MSFIFQLRQTSDSGAETDTVLGTSTAQIEDSWERVLCLLACPIIGRFSTFMLWFYKFSLFSHGAPTGPGINQLHKSLGRS